MFPVDYSSMNFLDFATMGFVVTAIYGLVHSDVTAGDICEDMIRDLSLDISTEGVSSPLEYILTEPVLEYVSCMREL